MGIGDVPIPNVYWSLKSLDWRKEMKDIAASGLFQIFGALVVLIAVILVVIWESAKKRLVVTFLAVNQAVIVEDGEGNPVRLLANPEPGYEVVGFEIQKNADPNFIQKNGWFTGRIAGLWLISLKPWEKIREFKLVHERMNKNMDESTKPADWILRDPEPQDEWFLLINTLHEFKVLGVELKDNRIIDVLGQGQFMLRLSKVAFYTRASKNRVLSIYDVIERRFSAAINDVAKELTYEKWKDAGKGPTDTFCTDTLFQEMNSGLAELCGYDLRTVFIVRWDLSTEDQQKKMRAKADAKIERDVANLKAESDNARTIALVKSLRKQFPNVSEEILLEKATEIVTTEAVSRMENLTVLSTGGGMNIAASPGNKKPKNNQRRP